MLTIEIELYVLMYVKQKLYYTEILSSSNQ